MNKFCKLFSANSPEFPKSKTFNESKIVGHGWEATGTWATGNWQLGNVPLILIDIVKIANWVYF